MSISYLRTRSVETHRDPTDILGKSAPSSLKETLEKWFFELAALEDAYITSRCTLRESRRNDVLRLKSAVDDVVASTRNLLVEDPVEGEEYLKTLMLTLK
ncbi:MAG: hypothetical protein QXW47_05455 [Candidatus Jordarchaeales archaeon]